MVQENALEIYVSLGWSQLVSHSCNVVFTKEIQYILMNAKVLAVDLDLARGLDWDFFGTSFYPF